MNSFSSGPIRQGTVNTIQQLERQLAIKNSNQQKLEAKVKQLNNELTRERQQSRRKMDNAKEAYEAVLKRAREETAVAEKKYQNQLANTRDRSKKYINSFRKMSEENRKLRAAKNSQIVTTPRGRNGFLTNMKKAMCMMMKRPATAFTALTAALAALGMTVIQQQQQLNQHRLDIQRIQNDYFNQLNKTNYYRDAFLGRAKIQTPSQYAGGGSLSRVLNSKNRAKHRKKIQDEANRIGPPPR